MSEDRINKIVKRLCFIILIIICNVIRCQTYYGKNNFGKLEFINDSVCELNFYHYISIYSPIIGNSKSHFLQNGWSFFLKKHIRQHLLRCCLFFLIIYIPIKHQIPILTILTILIHSYRCFSAASIFQRIFQIRMHCQPLTQFRYRSLVRCKIEIRSSL